MKKKKKKEEDNNVIQFIASHLGVSEWPPNSTEYDDDDGRNRI